MASKIGGWFKDEEFWRDITKSVLSGVILAVLLYVFAVFIGLAKAPNTRGQVLFALLMIPYVIGAGVNVVNEWSRTSGPLGGTLVFIGAAISYWAGPPLILYLMLFHRDIL